MGSSVSRIQSHQHPLPSREITDSTTTSWLLLPVLPPEVLLIILNLAHETMILSDWRLVSKQFNDLIVPIIYRHVTLNARVVACFQQSTPDRSAVQLRIANYVCNHTKHISIDRALHWPSVLELLYSLDNFRELRCVTFTKVSVLCGLPEAHK